MDDFAGKELKKAHLGRKLQRLNTLRRRRDLISSGNSSLRRRKRPFWALSRSDKEVRLGCDSCTHSAKCHFLLGNWHILRSRVCFSFFRLIRPFALPFHSRSRVFLFF